MSRLLKITAAVIALSMVAPSAANALNGWPWWWSLVLTKKKPVVVKAPTGAATPEAVLAEQIATSIAALPGAPTQAQIQAAINGVLASSTASSQVKQTALAVLEAAAGPTSPITTAAGASARTLAAASGSPVVSTSSATVKTIIAVVAVKTQIVTTLSGVTTALADTGTPSNSDYRPG
jgi:hypothetical protein